MSKQKIRIIVLLMSVSLGGLVAFQLYWISNAIGLEKDNFSRKVFEAMNSVVEKLEKTETIFMLAEETGAIIHQDSMPAFFYKEEEQTIKRLPFSDSLLTNYKRTYRIKSPFLLNSYAINKEYFNADSLFPQSDSVFYDFVAKSGHGEIPDMNVLHESIKHNLSKVHKKGELLKEVMKDVLKPEIDIKKRINEKQLQKFLEEEMSSRGLNTAYAYAIEDVEDNKRFFATSDHNYKESPYKARLFPNDLFSGNNFLLLYFPDKLTFIFKRTWFTLLSSATLIGIIIYCFTYAMLTLIRQKKLSEMKNDFINNMTHEFKTPIATVALTCEALTDPDVNKNEKLVQRYITIIKQENNRLGQQVEKVLQIASLDQKDFKLNLVKLDVHQIIAHAIENISIQVQNRNGIIEQQFNATNTAILADELHLTNIIYNLLDNANKYSPIDPMISVITNNHQNGLTITIKDKGLGIAKEHLSHVFEKFYRVSTGNLHDVKGFGLGLAYVQTMAEANGGWVTVASQLGKGSEFKLFLPANPQ